MNSIIQSEHYRELLGKPSVTRNVEGDAAEAEQPDERVYE
jgi:hypothetical protein